MIKIRYLTVLLGLFLLSGCCTSNYSSEITKILEPTQKKLVKFYTKNKHFPNTKERNKILKESGCEIRSNTCLANGMSFNIYDANLAGGQYKIGLKKGKSRCSIGIYSDGEASNINCYQDSCLGLKQ